MMKMEDFISKLVYIAEDGTEEGEAGQEVKAHDAEQREIIAQQATELTGWRTVAMGVGAIDEHALSLHLDEQAMRIKELEDKLDEYERGRTEAKP